jgi:hypothetical protein
MNHDHGSILYFLSDLHIINIIHALYEEFSYSFLYFNDNLLEAPSKLNNDQ